MRLTPDRIQLLVGYGLNEYQAKTYLSLLEFPALNASTLAKLAKVPRNRLYEVLEELQEIGLVEIILEEPRKYRARPLSTYLDRRIRGFKEQIQEIESRLPYLDTAFQPPPPEETEDLEVGEFRVVSGRRAVAREIDTLIEGATSSLVMVSSAGGFERVLRHAAMFAEHLEAEVAKGALRIELCLPASVRGMGGTEQLTTALSAALRWIDLAPQTISFIADERRMLSVHPIPDDNKLRSGRDLGILTTNTAFVRDHLNLVRRISGAAPEAPLETATPRAAPRA